MAMAKVYLFFVLLLLIIVKVKLDELRYVEECEYNVYLYSALIYYDFCRA